MESMNRVLMGSLVILLAAASQWSIAGESAQSLVGQYTKCMYDDADWQSMYSDMGDTRFSIQVSPHENSSIASLMVSGNSDYARVLSSYGRAALIDGALHESILLNETEVSGSHSERTEKESYLASFSNGSLTIQTTRRIYTNAIQREGVQTTVVATKASPNAIRLTLQRRNELNPNVIYDDRQIVCQKQ